MHGERKAFHFNFSPPWWLPAYMTSRSTFLLLLLLLFAHTSTAGGYLLQHHTKWCTAHTMLATIEDCKNAKKHLDPSAPAVESEELDNAPKGCSRYEGKWFFNTHAKGKLDGASEPVCKADAGKASAALNTMSCPCSVCF